MSPTRSTTGTSHPAATLPEPLIVGTCEMTRLVRAADWASTPLGTLETWSPELLSIVNTILCAPLPMFVMWGPDLIMIYNEAARPITSAKHPQSLGQTCAQAWKEAWHIVGPELEQVFHHGAVIRKEGVLVPLEMNGTLQDVYFDYSYSPLFEQGEIAGVLVVCQNITTAVLAGRALNQAEAQSARIEERLQMALSAADGVGIWDWDVKENRVYTDAHFASLYGADPEKALNGMPIETFMQNLHEDDRERVATLIATAMETGREFEAEYRLVQSNGSVRWVAAKGRCTFDSQGAPTRFPGVTIDITKRKNTELTLRAAEESLSIAAETASLGTWELNLETGTMRCSHLCKANFGRSPQDPFNYSDLRACIHPEDAPGMQAAVDEAVATQSTYRFEYRVTWPDGTPHWIIASGRALYDPSGKPIRMAGVTMNVTERHRAQAALMQTEKLAAVGRLAASIAHEINNPLESVTNLLYLARQSKTYAEVQQYLDTAERELRRVSVISNQTLRFYRQSTNPTAVTCEQLFESTLAVFQGRLINAGITVEKRKRAKAAILCFDGEIRQVLNNLIGNAIDAMPPAGGRLLLRSLDGIEWRSGRRGLILTVADTGTGMSPAVAKKIFEAFYTTKGISGTGLGLWVSKEIVSRHQGKLTVRSTQQTDRSGTVIRLFLPLEPAPR